MSITRSEYERAVYMCTPAAEILNASLRRDTRGRRSLPAIIYLVGLCLSFQNRKSGTVASIHKTLTRDLPRDLQWELGVLKGPGHAPTILTEWRLYNFTRTFSRIEYGYARQPDLTEEERATRFGSVEALSQALLRQTLIPRPGGSTDYAVDGTGIDAPERGHRKPKDLPDPDGHEEQTDTQPTEPPVANSIATGQGCKGASDAAWGWRTGHSGRSIYFGYDIEGLIRVPAVGQRGDTRNEPALLEALRVLPAGTDVVDPVLGMLDLLQSDGIPVRRLLNDRHYSYKAYDRWLVELMKRGIQQVSDLRSDDHGFADWNGLRMAAGHPHCPKTPDELAVIQAPGHDATAAEREAFIAKIEERQAYAVQIVNRPTADNQRIKCRCPARNGTIGCPLVEGTMAVALEAELDYIKEPPSGSGCPLICQQDTVTLRIENDDHKVIVKPLQHHYWGSPAWQEDYARRTHIEGFFGCLQNDEIGTVDGSTHQQRGLAAVTIIYSMAAAISNAHILRLWHEQTGLGGPEHPLLTPDPTFYGFTELDEIGAREIDQQGAEKPVGEPSLHVA